jgi:glycerophosphoryl diester phosphodiesterase
MPFFLVFFSCGNFDPPAETSGVSAVTTLSLKKLELHGHRGARGLAPENTWPAFEAGIRNGMTAVELDINLTADNDLIIHHDSFTNSKLCRTDDGQKIKPVPIHLLTVKELKKLDCGSLKNEKFPEQEKIPLTRLLTLTDFFLRVAELAKSEENAHSVIFNIDVKFPPRLTPSDAHLEKFAKLLLEQVAKAGMTDRIMVQSFETRLLPFIKEITPKVRTAALFQWSQWPGVSRRTPEMMIQRVLSIQADIVAPNRKDTNEVLVKLAHQNGLLIIPWTVNEAEEIRSLIRMGVDGIITDYPNRLKTIADEMTVAVRH